MWLAKNILESNSWTKILPDVDFFVAFTSPRWKLIFIFFPLFSSFPLDYPVRYINIKFLGLEI